MTHDFSETPDPHDLLQDRIAEALDSRGIHQRGELGFDYVVRAILSEAFERSVEQVPAYLDRNHPESKNAHLRVYEVALEMPEEELSELIAAFDKTWTYYTQLEPEEYVDCDNCGSGNYESLEIDAENGRFTIEHQFGCYGGDGINGGTVADALEYLRKAADTVGDDNKHKQMEELIANFEDIADRDYMLP